MDFSSLLILFSLPLPCPPHLIPLFFPSLLLLCPFRIKGEMEQRACPTNMSPRATVPTITVLRLTRKRTTCGASYPILFTTPSTITPFMTLMTTRHFVPAPKKDAFSFSHVQRSFFHPTSNAYPRLTIRHFFHVFHTLVTLVRKDKLIGHFVDRYRTEGQSILGR